MIDEAKALTKRSAVSTLVLLVVLLVFRSVVSWVVVALGRPWKTQVDCARIWV